MKGVRLSGLEHSRDPTGEGIIFNTFCNLRRYPVVYKPQDVLDVLKQSRMNQLALGDFLISVNTQS